MLETQRLKKLFNAREGKIMRDLEKIECLGITRDRSPAIRAHFGDIGDSTRGVFLFASPIDRQTMRVVASSDCGWEHVSVSRQGRCPNWPEMEAVKRAFFEDHEVCFQLHVAVMDHLSFHGTCLHIWRPTAEIFPLPPRWMVGPYEGYEEEMEAAMNLSQA